MIKPKRFMKNGYKILWTDNALEELQETYSYLELNWTALEELQETYSYLELNWTGRVLKRLSMELDRALNLISKNPKVFQISEYKNIRKIVLLRFNTLYYRVDEANKTVEILSFFSNRQSMDSRKI